MVEVKHGTFGSVGSEEVKSQPVSEPDLRSLVELGCVKDELKIANMVFEMRSLNASERLNAAEFMGEEPDSKKLFELNVLLLAMSIVTVNGAPLETLHDGSADSVLSARRQIIAQLQPAVLAELLRFHHKLTERSDAQFTVDQVKK